MHSQLDIRREEAIAEDKYINEVTPSLQRLQFQHEAATSHVGIGIY